MMVDVNKEEKQDVDVEVERPRAFLKMKWNGRCLNCEAERENMIEECSKVEG
jgi:hypothetical protein